MGNGSTVAGGVTPPAVELRGIGKRFGDVVANEGIDFSLARGETHALLGENGAGKSTLVKILYGLVRPDTGTVLVDGTPVEIGSPRDAIAAGIGIVTQHFALVRTMTVTENVVLGRTRGLRVDLDGARAAVEEAAARLGIRIDPLARVADLSVGEQQRVEIVKALYNRCRVLILDEPTAVLVPQEVDALFASLRRLCDEGMSVIFISHKLHEVRRIADRVTVLRRGRLVGTRVTAEIDNRELAELMVGRTVSAVERPVSGGSGTAEPVLRLRGIRAEARGIPVLAGLDLEVRAGEILGIAGVSGNGQTELVQALCGMRSLSAGTVEVAGTDMTGASPGELVAAGIGRIPEDARASVVGELSVAHNLVLERLTEFGTGPLLDDRAVRREAEALIERFEIKARPGDAVATLSGGNLQKVLLARVLARDPAVLVVAQPTRGLDVGATEYVRRSLLAQRERGCAVLLVSEDLDELLQLSDRIAVMYEGRLVGEMDVHDATPERLGLLMAGLEGAERDAA